MLTPEQKSKLEPLIHHEKYGKILIEVMKSWETTNPSKRIFGIRLAKNLKNWEVDPLYDNRCCLIGAALSGKRTNMASYCKSISDNYSVLHNDTENLVNGFDQNCSLYSLRSSEAYIFGSQVSEIIFGKVS